MKHQRILNWVNRIRKKHFGKGPLKRLPKGNSGRSSSCPIHNSFWKPGYGGDADPSGIYPDSEYEEMIPIPKTIRRFMVDFDNGKYPELER